MGVDPGVVNDATLRRTLAGAAVGGSLFGVMAVYRSLMAGGPLLEYAGPVAFMAVLGGTVGGLAGPLVGEAWTRWRRDREGGGGGEEGQAERVNGGRQPLWVNLLAGVAVGWGVGTAWGRIWVGVALGLVLALAARRIFR